jgi:hypothetical protein
VVLVHTCPKRNQTRLSIYWPQILCTTDVTMPPKQWHIHTLFLFSPTRSRMEPANDGCYTEYAEGKMRKNRCGNKVPSKCTNIHTRSSLEARRRTRDNGHMHAASVRFPRSFGAALLLAAVSRITNEPISISPHPTTVLHVPPPSMRRWAAREIVCASF